MDGAPAFASPRLAVKGFISHVSDLSRFGASISLLSSASSIHSYMMLAVLQYVCTYRIKKASNADQANVSILQWGDKKKIGSFSSLIFYYQSFFRPLCNCLHSLLQSRQERSALDNVRVQILFPHPVHSSNVWTTIIINY